MTRDLAITLLAFAIVIAYRLFRNWRTCRARVADLEAAIRNHKEAAPDEQVNRVLWSVLKA